MKPCTHLPEVIQSIRAGQWPQAAPADLQAHVATCPSCAGEARILSAFAASRQSAIRTTPPPSPELLWWKAQLRRRQQAIERLNYPTFAISTATIAASLLLMLTALAAAGRHIAWSHVLAQFSPAQWNIWNTWTVIPIATSLCAFVAIAVVLGLGISKERG